MSEEETPYGEKEKTTPGIKGLTDLALKLSNLRTLAATNALAASMDEGTSTVFTRSEAIAHYAFLALVLLSTEDIVKEGQLLIRTIK